MLVSLSVICKVLGAAAIFGSVGAALVSGRRRDRERLRRLDALIAFAVFAREQVDRYLTPVSEIMKRCDPAVWRDCLLGSPDGTPVPRDMEEFGRVTSAGRYAADGRAALAEFSASFGRSYREEEVRCCDACAGALKEVRASLERTLRDRRRSDEVLSLCAAAAAVLLLL